MGMAAQRVGGKNYVAALLLVEPGRVASDGLKAPARHHLVCMCWCMDVCLPLAKLPMALILAGAWKSAEPRSLPVICSTIYDNITVNHMNIPFSPHGEYLETEQLNNVLVSCRYIQLDRLPQQRAIPISVNATPPSPASMMRIQSNARPSLLDTVRLCDMCSHLTHVPSHILTLIF